MEQLVAKMTKKVGQTQRRQHLERCSSLVAEVEMKGLLLVVLPVYDIASSSAPEVTSLYVTTWVRVGVNRAQTCTIQVVSSMFRRVPFVSIEFWMMHSVSFS